MSTRSGQCRALPDAPEGKLQDLIETAKAHIRAQGQMPFWVVPKNRYKINVRVALMNLRLTGIQLLAAIWCLWQSDVCLNLKRGSVLKAWP